MTTAAQIKSLIKLHYEKDDAGFLTKALQIAAYEARQGHTALAREIRGLTKQPQAETEPVPDPPDDTSPDTNPPCIADNGFVAKTNPSGRFSELVVPDELQNRLRRIVLEYRRKYELERHGLKHRRRILLAGPPGTGKTMTASAIAHELRLPLYIVLTEQIVTKHTGESGAELRQVFDKIRDDRGIYFFDEFEAIGDDGGGDDSAGERRRLLNLFLEFAEQDLSDSIIIAATDKVDRLNRALFFRFDDVLYYQLPGERETKNLIENLLGSFLGTRDISGLCTITGLFPVMSGLSHAEIVSACIDVKKDAILDGSKIISIDRLKKILKERLIQ